MDGITPWHHLIIQQRTAWPEHDEEAGHGDVGAIVLAATWRSHPWRTTRCVHIGQSWHVQVAALRSPPWPCASHMLHMWHSSLLMRSTTWSVWHTSANTEPQESFHMERHISPKKTARHDHVSVRLSSINTHPAHSFLTQCPVPPCNMCVTSW